VSAPRPNANLAGVTPLERPPIRQSIVVRQGIERTFSTFVSRIGQWWPTIPFSFGQHSIVSVTFETRLGGRIYETREDGSVVEWGTVLDWSPPQRFVMSWNITGVPTDVEVSFTGESDTTTRVDLEHRGWERLTEAQLGDDCALPGGYLGGSFTRGWAVILDRFAMAVEASS
jgi:uncharacterized protein YndB with AHSA1/START domain